MAYIPKVLFLNPWDRIIGPNRYLIEMLRNLPDLAKQATVIFHEHSNAISEYKEIGCSVMVSSDIAQVRAKFSISNFWGILKHHTIGLFRTLKLIRDIKPDIIVSNTEQLMLGNIASRLLEIPHVKIFHAVTFAYRLKKRPGIMKAYLRILTIGSKYVIAVSETLKNSLISGGLRDDKVVAVPNPIPAEELYKASLNPLPEELKSKLAGRSPILLNVGRISPMKGQDQLVKALPEIRNACPEVLCIFAGNVGSNSGAEDTQVFIENIRKLIQELKLENNILFLGEIDYLPSLLRAADIYVHTSWTESFGRVVAESLVCDTPVVVYDSDALPEVAGPGGVCVKAGDVNALAAVVVDLMKDNGKRKCLAEAGRRHVAESFGAKAMAHLLEKVIIEAAHGEKVKE